MSNTLVALALICFAAAQVIPHVGPVKSHIPLVYKVNINDAPKVRWAKMLIDFQEPLARFMQYFDLLPFPKTFFNGVEWYAKNEFKYQDFVAQADAIAQLSGYPFQKIFFLNFMYEYSTLKACTGLLVRTEDGKILHGRNLDFPMWELLAKLVVNVQYYKDGQKLFSVDTIVGSVFTLTAIKPGAFAVEVNTRKQYHFQDDFINVLIDNAIPTCWLLRKVVEEETTYAGAIHRLKSERIGGPVYYVVSGVKGNEGAVIERDNDKVHGFYELSDTVWYLCQTNYDRDQPDPRLDERRIPVQKRMNERGVKGFTTQTLYDTFMSQYPSFNIETILTSVMVSADGYHNTTVWYGDNPKPHIEQLTQ